MEISTVHEGGSPIKYGKGGKIAIQSQRRELRQFDGKPYIMEGTIINYFDNIKQR